jgi:hypothetical protein
VINTILILLALNTLINYILVKLKLVKPTKGALFCGLWCYCGTEPADGQKLKILALYNMARGDHATGMCSDDAILKSTANAKEFLVGHSDLFDFKKRTIKNFTVLGHCRAATSSYSREKVEFAHPHGIKKNPDDKRPFLFGVHNGTIHNIYDLCHKYELEMDSSKTSDSMHLFNIITKGWEVKNNDIFREYKGSATVVFYPINAKNTVYVHRDEERELYCWNETENKVYISSVKDALMAIGASKEEIVEFEPGMLIKFTNGHKTKSWDLKEKKPYERPRIQNINNRTNPRAGAYSERAPHTKSSTRDGFYWENHLIHFNGHAYTGSLYLEKNGRRIERDVNQTDRDKYEILYCIMGIPMKDKENYAIVYQMCVKGDSFDPSKFKKLTPAILGLHSLYPVLGKYYDSSSDGTKIFWFRELCKLNEPDDTYSWISPLIGKEFTINRGGVLVSEGVALSVNESEFATEMSSKEAVIYLIDKKICLDELYSNAAELFDDFVKLKCIAVRPDTFDNFLDDLITVLKEFGHVSKTEIHQAEQLRFAESYGAIMDASSEMINLVSEYLLTTCQSEITKNARIKNSSSKSIEQPKIDFADEDNSEEVLEDFHEKTDDSDYYSTKEFKNQFLFSNCDSLEDAITAYVATDDHKHIMPFLRSLNDLFRDLNCITGSDWFENKRASFDLLKQRMSMAFELLKTEPYYLNILDDFRGTEVNLEDCVAGLVKKIQVLSNRNTVTEEDKTKLALSRLALTYIVEKAKTLDRSKLLVNHNINSKELDTLCLNS